MILFKAIMHLTCFPRENDLLICFIWYVKEKRSVRHVDLLLVPVYIEAKVYDVLAVFKLEYRLELVVGIGISNWV